MYRCLTNGLSFKVGGGNVLTLCPPLTITRAELDTALDILDACHCEERSDAAIPIAVRTPDGIAASLRSSQ